MKHEEILRAGVTMEQILHHREKRVWMRERLWPDGAACAVGFGMNLPGSCKRYPLADRGFETGVKELRRIFAAEELLRAEVWCDESGMEALFFLRAEARTIKQRTVTLEEKHPLGRLWDIDVFSRTGAVGRKEFNLPGRRCILCGEAVNFCRYSGKHTAKEAALHCAEMLESYFREEDAARTAEIAAAALVQEVDATPKPGLVDRKNAGSHTDMEYPLFLRSTAALTPWFRRFFNIGWDMAGSGAEDRFAALQRMGMQAEEEMLRATGGVNTHKGFIFSAAIMCAALGELRAEDVRIGNEEELFRRCASLGKVACAAQGSGAAGARKEAAEGFPAVRKVGLPVLRKALRRGTAWNEAALLTLLALIGAVEDTNMIRRGGLAQAERCREQARQLRGRVTAEDIGVVMETLDAEYQQLRLSPGGCADLLALTLMTEQLQRAELL